MEIYNDVLAAVFAFCSQRDLMRWMCVSKQFHKVIGEIVQTGSLAEVSRRGQYVALRRYITLGAVDWNRVLFAACAGGQMCIVKLAISKGAQSLEWGLANACSGGHRAIVELLLSKGVKRLDYGLDCACLGGHTDIAKILIDKGADWGSVAETIKKKYGGVIKMLM